MQNDSKDQEEGQKVCWSQSLSKNSPESPKCSYPLSCIISLV